MSNVTQNQLLDVFVRSIDPDQWIASGKKLSELTFSQSEKDRKLMALALEDHPELAAHLSRWTIRVGKLVGQEKKVGDVLTEETLRALWNETRSVS
ncbi:MAG TPA: hypothetical protein VIJ78_10290 [Pseudolabrys sp.]